jgi:hypothetical protein
MAEHQTPVDIGNRAAQHCGAEMMDVTLGFSEVSKTARQISFVYGKLRRAELERNVWTFAVRHAALRAIDANTMLLQPTLWVSGITYFAGSIVNDGNGTDWVSRIQNNLNNQPNSSSAWEPYFGPRTVSLYDPALSYFAGELVYTDAGDGTYRVYVSLQTGNSDVPATATAWSAATTYNTAQVVTYLSVAYMSLFDLNLNQQPNLAPAAWSAVTTYTAAQKVYNPIDGLIYSSVGSGNLNNNPATDLGVHWTNTRVLCPWTTVFSAGAGSLKWLEIGGAEFASGVGLTTLNIIYPLGSGPSSQSATKNVFRLPAGFLREAPQDPKAGSTSWLGAPTNSLYNDWLFENHYLLTSCGNVIVLRFVADMQDVSRMKTMFCEGLAARIAMEVCEPLTNSTAKLGAITQAYNKVMGEARQINAIEAGSEEPPLDDWLACRA